MPEDMWDELRTSRWGIFCPSPHADHLGTELATCLHSCPIAELYSPPPQCGASGYCILKCDLILLASKNNWVLALGASFLSQAVAPRSPCSATCRMVP